MAAPARTLEQVLDVETPEQIVFSFEIAGVGSRAAAALIDSTLLFIAIIVVGTITATLGQSVVRGVNAGSWSGPLLVAALIFALFALLWGYYVLFEAFWDGQTPGKRIVGLRVVRDGGYGITFGASAIRNIMRIVDAQPVPSYFVAIVSVIVSKSGKRLGDYAAGTIVVRERAQPENAVPVARTAVEPAGAPTAVLTDAEFELLDRYMQRRATLDPMHAAKFGAELAARFRKWMPAHTAQDGTFLSALYDAERGARQRGAASRSDTGAAREQHALVAQGTTRWRAFAARLAGARRGGLGGMTEEQVSAFVADYRALTTDLARLTTASRGRDNPTLWYLNRLVAAGHAMLYRERPIAPRSIWRFMTRTVPAEVRRSAMPIGLAAALFFVPAAVAYIAVVREPAVAPRFIPPTMIDRAEQGVARAREGTGYIRDDPFVRPLMSSVIITNNVQVTFAAFAGGITLGVGTVYALVQNGVMLGGIFGLYQSKGILPLIVAFVAPHGVLELSAICIAGGAGFLIAGAILIPGARTRREALVANGQRAARLIAACTLLLLVAGSLEGLISPIPWWSLAQKLTVSGLTALMLVIYINLRDPSHETTAAARGPAPG